MKKLLSLVLAFSLIMPLFSCAVKEKEEDKTDSNEPKFAVVEPVDYEYASSDSSLNQYVENVSVSKVYDIDSSDLAGSSGGNSWGGYMGRGVRMSDGTLYSYVVFSDEVVEDPELDKVFYIYKFSGKKWSRVAGPFRAGRNPISLLKDPSADKFYAVVWPNIQPTVMTFDPKNITKPEISYCLEYKDGGADKSWCPNPTNYNSAGISPDGLIWITASVGGKTWDQDYFSHGTYNTKDKTWTPVKRLDVDQKHCYLFIIPEENGTMSFVAAQDVPWRSAGMVKPSDDTFDYVFPALRLFRTEDLGETFKTLTIHEELQTKEFMYMNVINNYTGDYIKGADGKYHIVYTATGASLKGEKALFHAIYDKSGQLELIRLPFGDGKEGEPLAYSRMALDKDGRAYYISYYMGTSKIKVYAVDSENGIKYSDPVEFDLGAGNEVAYSGLWPFTTRCGNSNENYIDITYPSGENGTNIKYFRISLK